MRRADSHLRPLQPIAGTVAVLASLFGFSTRCPGDPLPTPNQVTSPANQNSAYEKWMESWTQGNIVRAFMNGPREVRVIVMAQEGDSPKSSTGVEIPFRQYGVQIAVDGQYNQFMREQFSDKGDFQDDLTPEQMRQLDELLARLPGDERRLPPPERRLLVRIPQDGKFTAQVYDRANLPTPVLQLLWFLRASVRSWGLKFKPIGEKVDNQRPPKVSPQARPVKRLPHWPVDAVQYHSPPTGNRAIYQSRAGALLLWDTAVRKVVATLAPRATQYRVAYAPKRDIVAVGSNPGNTGYQIRLWDLRSGRLMHELYPFEQQGNLAEAGLLWSPDGEYLLAPIKPDGTYFPASIAVWNARSGRQRAEFIGNMPELSAISWSNTVQLTGRTKDGRVLTWNAQSAFRQIRDLEKSLPPVP